MYAPILSRPTENAIEEERSDRDTVEEVQLDSDGEEKEYAEFTMEELLLRERLLKAELGLSVDEAVPDPDQEAAKDD